LPGKRHNYISVFAGLSGEFLHVTGEPGGAWRPGGVVPLKCHDNCAVFRDADRKIANRRQASERLVLVDLAHQNCCLNAALFLFISETNLPAR
jgi:hypothetical protein